MLQHEEIEAASWDEPVELAAVALKDQQERLFQKLAAEAACLVMEDVGAVLALAEMHWELEMDSEPG